jgi:hypothetical protein
VATNVEKLKAAGVIKEPLQQEYRDVLESISSKDAEVIASVSKRLDDAGKAAGRPQDEISKMFIVI